MRRCYFDSRVRSINGGYNQNHADSQGLFTLRFCYPLLMSSVTTQAISMGLLSRPPYDFVRDYAPVTMVASAPLALMIHASLPAKSTKDFIALAKARPGELKYSKIIRQLGLRQD